MHALAALLFVVAADLFTPHRAAAPPPDPIPTLVSCSAGQRRAVASALVAHARARGTARGAAFVTSWLASDRFVCRVEGDATLVFDSRCPGGTLSARARRSDEKRGFTVEQLSASANPQCMNHEEQLRF